MYSQGSLQNTGNNLDLAIEGEGFFRVQLYDGSFGYTRDGTFKIDSNGQIVNSNGYKLSPEIIMPEEFVFSDISISQDGLVTVKVAGDDTPIEVGRISIYRFVNPAGLKNIGQNLVKTSAASGLPVGGKPGFFGMGKIQQGFIEMSNVQVVEEMVNMIVAQRAYELNSKAIITSDSMLATANALKR